MSARSVDHLPVAALAGTCQCGKVGFGNRADAKAQAKRHVGRGDVPTSGHVRLSAYPCPETPGLFHIGHSSAGNRQRRREETS